LREQLDAPATQKKRFPEGNGLVTTMEKTTFTSEKSEFSL
jgi:hypothetical protein